LIAAAPSGVGDDKVSRMIDSRSPSGHGDTLGNNVMAVIVLFAEPHRLVDLSGCIDH
jgi:hypothetical protein